MIHTYSDECIKSALADEAGRIERQVREALATVQAQLKALEQDTGAQLEREISALEDRARSVSARLIDLEKRLERKFAALSTTRRRGRN